MYSWEIKQLLELEKYYINILTYNQIFDTSPQIDNIKFNKENLSYYLHTSDNYEFNFKVYLKDKKSKRIEK